MNRIRIALANAGFRLALLIIDVCTIGKPDKRRAAYEELLRVIAKDPEPTIKE